MVLLKYTDTKWKGNLLVVDRFDGSRIEESDLRQCKHCQCLWKFEPGSGKLRGYCWKCAGHLCGKKACLEGCYPAMQRIDDSEAMFRFNKAAIEAAVRHRNWLERVFG